MQAAQQFGRGHAPSVLERLKSQYDPTNIVDQIEMDLLESEISDEAQV